MADNDKNDDLHTYGSIVSARFVVKAIERFL
jgi:hypothetical protein